jgi:hypothetical protein
MPVPPCRAATQARGCFIVDKCPRFSIARTPGSAPRNSTILWSTTGVNWAHALSTYGLSRNGATTACVSALLTTGMISMVAP